jgi:transaldolase
LADQMDRPVDPAVVASLEHYLADFRAAYEPDGLTPEGFARFGATVRTLRQFLGALAGLAEVTRDAVWPEPIPK